MSMSTSVVGVRDLDGKFAKMLAVKQACDEANVSYPLEVVDYFEGEAHETPRYLVGKMEEVKIKVNQSTDLSSTNTWTVVLADLPPDVKAVRFRNSY